MQQLVLGSEEFEAGDMASFNPGDVIPQREVASLEDFLPQSSCCA
jgi:hypothetical protein